MNGEGEGKGRGRDVKWAEGMGWLGVKGGFRGKEGTLEEEDKGKREAKGGEGGAGGAGCFGGSKEEKEGS